MKMTVKFCKLAYKLANDVFYGVLIKENEHYFYVVQEGMSTVRELQKENWDLEIIQENTCDFFMHEINR